MTWVGPLTELAVLTQATPDTASNGPVVVIVLAVVAAAGTVATALAPTFVEIVKNRGARTARPGSTPPTSAPQPSQGSTGGSGPAGGGAAAGIPEPVAAASVATPAPPPAVQSAFSGFTMVEQAVLDYRHQRDEAMRRYDGVLDELDDAREVIRNQAVIIARYEGTRDNGRNAYNYGRHGMDRQEQGWRR